MGPHSAHRAVGITEPRPEHAAPTRLTEGPALQVSAGGGPAPDSSPPQCPALAPVEPPCFPRTCSGSTFPTPQAAPEGQLPPSCQAHPGAGGEPGPLDKEQAAGAHRQVQEPWLGLTAAGVGME